MPFPTVIGSPILLSTQYITIPPSPSLAKGEFVAQWGLLFLAESDNNNKIN